MNILFLTRKWPPAMGGMEVYCAELVAELRRDHDVELIALPGRLDGGAPGAAALLGFAFRAAWRALAGPGGRDVLHGGDMAVWPLVALAKVRSPRAAAVLSAHGTDVSYAARAGARAAAYRLYMRLGARVLRRSRVAANSRATAEGARALGFGRVAVIPLATRAGPAEAPPPPERNLLFAGRLVRRKGLAWFVAEVLPHLPEDITLDVAGTVWDEDERSALDHPWVRYLGRVAAEELPARMAGALAVVAPNLADRPGHLEGFGLVAVEAAAAGGVVLAARTGGFTDSVIEGETGLLLPPQSAPDWIAAIRDIAAWDPARRAAFVTGAQRAARTHFAWDRVARETAALYRQV